MDPSNRLEIKLIPFNTIGSTSTWAKENTAKLDASKLTVVTAKTQTAGRGRFDNVWESPSGLNLYATYCFFAKKLPENVGNIPQIMALSVATILKERKFSPRLKWSNDILLNEKKAGGILGEVKKVTDGYWIITGIGLNINMPQKELDKINQPATSLMVESKSKWDLEGIQKALTEEFHKNLELFSEKGFTPFIKDLRETCAHARDQLISFHHKKEIFEGYFQKINNDGSLSLKIKTSGKIERFNAGEYPGPSE